MIFGQTLGKFLKKLLLSLMGVIMPIYIYESMTMEGVVSKLLQQLGAQIFPIYSYVSTEDTSLHREDAIELEYLYYDELTHMMEEENGELVAESVKVELVAIDPERTRSMVEGQAGTFTPHTRQYITNLDAFESYDDLTKHFYIIDDVTSVEEGEINYQELLKKDLTISKEGDAPQILLYHTHSQEGFADSVPGDDNTTIMGVGAYLAGVLQNTYGYKVLHHLGKYDVESRDNAYARSLPEIKQILDENPSIQVVIDLHRDGINEANGKLMTQVDGRDTAKFMFFNGISKTNSQGHIDYLENPYLQDNLAFSLQMKLKADEYYPGVARKNYINGYRYNMHLKARTILIELGAQNNTFGEAINACDILAHLLDMVLTGQ
ncbi:MAG: stage II sporulation protein P [Lachnospiraceae bacterium]|nr:stage II sporulation protein P [Lachnospiraceae bacterium]